MINQPRGELVPGGLAMVIGGPERPEDIGLLVTLIELAQPGQYYKHPSWSHDLNEENEAAWLVELNEEEGALKRPQHLLPINPSADPLEITQQQEVEA